MKAAKKLGYPEFKASSGWLTRFKERSNLSQHKLCGESADVPEATEADKSLSEKANKCEGGKKSKERLTVAFFVSATGERRKPVVIGKYVSPRCLKNINKDDLPCQYLNQQKAWVTPDILHKFTFELLPS